MRRKKENGFTVVELLITVLFLAILLGMALRVGKSARQQSEFAAGINTFVADLSTARQWASRENKYMAFEFDTGGSSYKMLTQRKVYGTDFKEWKKVEPLDGMPFISTSTNFAVSPMGLIVPYPFLPGSQPFNVKLEFVKKDDVTGDLSYKKTLTIFPYGGVKIE